jgi:hypothetical protein
MERPLTILPKVLAIGLATQLSGKTPSVMEDLSDQVITGASDDARKIHEPVDQAQYVVRGNMPLQNKAVEQRSVRHRRSTIIGPSPRRCGHFSRLASRMGRSRPSSFRRELGRGGELPVQDLMGLDVSVIDVQPINDFDDIGRKIVYRPPGFITLLAVIVA